MGAPMPRATTAPDAASGEDGCSPRGAVHRRRSQAVECVVAFRLALSFQLTHKATCRGGGCLTRHCHFIHVCLGGLTIWRMQCTTCKAVCTVLPHFVLR